MKSWHIQSHTLPPDIQIDKYDDMNVLLLLQQQTYYNSKVKNTVQKGSFDRNHDCIYFPNLHSRPVKLQVITSGGCSN